MAPALFSHAQGLAVFPADWPMRPEDADGSAMVRVRVEVKGKGVAHRGAAVWADDLPATDSGAGDQAVAALLPQPPSEPVADITMEEEAEPTADRSAQAAGKIAPEAAVALGRVTSEVPRGAARGAAATALCSAAALQRLKWDPGTG